MRRVPFLNRIHSEGKLKLVEPSPEIKDAYLQRANESLSSAKVLLDINTQTWPFQITYFVTYSFARANSVYPDSFLHYCLVKSLTDEGLPFFLCVN